MLTNKKILKTPQTPQETIHHTQKTLTNYSVPAEQRL